MGAYVAAPGYSNHQDGLALDLGTRKGKGGLIKLYKGSWFHNWLKANARTYQFEPLADRGLALDLPAAEAGARRRPRVWSRRGDPDARCRRRLEVPEDRRSSPAIAARSRPHPALERHAGRASRDRRRRPPARLLVGDDDPAQAHGGLGRPRSGAGRRRERHGTVATDTDRAAARPLHRRQGRPDLPLHLPCADDEERADDLCGRVAPSSSPTGSAGRRRRSAG